MSSEPCRHCRLREGAWRILRERVAEARGQCADPEHTDSIDELLAFIDGTGWAEPLRPDPDVIDDLYREAFLREAIIALGAEVKWRASTHGTGVYIATEREPKECAQRAIKLWVAYRNIHRGTP